MNDLLEIRRKLEARVADVAVMLLPGGHREGHEWRAGSLKGEKGQSLGVHLDGAKVGIWSDFHTGEAGDLIDLWCAVRGRPLAQSLDEIRDYVGIKRYEPARDPKPQYVRPPKPKCVKPRARVRDYLVEVRAIDPAVLDAYHVGEDGDRIIFPFLLPGGELAMAKVREAIDGAKPVPTAANCEPVLFGWQAIPDSAREVVLTEGEIDALSMATFGFPALSVPYGGGGKGKQNWIENEFDRLARFEKIYLALDMDEPGEQAAIEIASRLGRHRCYRVTLPAKDANECLMSGIARDVIATAIACAANLDPEGLKSAAQFEGRVVRLFWPAGGQEPGYSLPYASLHQKLLFRPGELTLWTGDPGSGKSALLSDVIPKWIQEGSRVCLASFEMQPERTLKRLVKQAGGVDRPMEFFIHDVLAFLDRGLLLYEKVGKMGIDPLLEVFDYARAKYGCDQFVIDSLLRLGIEADDYSAQEKAVFRLVDWTVEHNVHSHLVAHSRKPGQERGVPQTADVKGAMEIGANAFNIIGIYRNRKLEHPADMPDRPAFTDEPGVVLNIAKQRNGDFEGQIKLYFNLLTYQYFSVADNKRFSRCYIGEDQTTLHGNLAETA